MDGFLAILGILVVVIGMYLGTAYLNKNTAIPEGTIKAGCDACNSPHCSVRDEEFIDPKDCELT
jgi:hypothetical protein